MSLDKYFKRKSIEDKESIKASSHVTQSSSKKSHIEINPDTLLVDPGLRRPIYEYHVNDRDTIRRAYLQKGPYQPSHYDFPYMFELISNACLYNIVFVNNLPPHLKNFGSATEVYHHAWTTVEAYIYQTYCIHMLINV